MTEQELMPFDSIAELEEAVSGLYQNQWFENILGRADHPISRLSQRNRSAFEDLVLRPRVMVDVSERSMVTQVLGDEIAIPVMLDPLGDQGRFHRDAELASARAARSVGTMAAISTIATLPIEDIAEQSNARLWFQLYVYRDRSVAEDLIRRAEASGYRALVITVDNQAYRSPERDPLGRGANPAERRPITNLLRYPNAPTAADTYFEYKALDFTWHDLAWIKSVTSLPIVLKGIQTAEDMLLCREFGVSGVVVSNHGGYSPFGVGASLEILPEVAEVAGEVEVYLDGGVRSGIDVLKALALGARAVMIGRPMVWGLLAGGEAGVQKVLEILKEELHVAMGMSGVTDVQKVSASLIRR